MYFWTLPVTVALGAVGAAETSLTTGWALGTLVVTGEVAVGAGLVLKVMTCCAALLPEAEDMTMNLVGGGEGWLGVPGRPTRVCTGRVMALGTFSKLGGRGGPETASAWGEAV